MNIIIALVAVVAMLACLVIIPFGLPGLWLIVVITLALVLAGKLTWTFGLVVAGSALIAEVAIGSLGRGSPGLTLHWAASVGNLDSRWRYMGVAQALDRKSTRLNSSHSQQSRMPSSA